MFTDLRLSAVVASLFHFFRLIRLFYVYRDACWFQVLDTGSNSLHQVRKRKKSVSDILPKGNMRFFFDGDRNSLNYLRFASITQRQSDVSYQVFIFYFRAVVADFYSMCTSMLYIVEFIDSRLV